MTLQVAPPGSGFRDASGDAAGFRVQGGESGGWYLVGLVEVGLLLFALLPLQSLLLRLLRVPDSDAQDYLGTPNQIQHTVVSKGSSFEWLSS